MIELLFLIYQLYPLNASIVAWPSWYQQRRTQQHKKQRHPEIQKSLKKVFMHNSNSFLQLRYCHHFLPFVIIRLESLADKITQNLYYISHTDYQCKTDNDIQWEYAN